MRLPPIAPADLSPLQRPLYDGMRSGVSAKYDLFTTTRTDGALLGPWNAWLNQPEVGAAFWTVTQAMTAFKVLPDAVRQVAILAVGARFGAAYEIDAHGAVAQARHAMSDQRLSTLAAGERPPDLTNEEATDRRAVALFGQAGANELIDLVGHTCFVAVTLNGFAIPVPEDEAAGSGERA